MTPGTDVGSANNFHSHGLPWQVVSISELPPSAVIQMITAVRQACGLPYRMVCNRVYYVVDLETEEATNTRMIAFTYDHQGYLAVISDFDQGNG